MEKDYQHKVFCHVFDQCVQNAKTVTSILKHIFFKLRQSTPHVKYAHLRSDNAGCYHGAESLLSIEQLFKDTGVWIRTIDFSDPQGGKGPCDRLAAVINCSVRRFVNERNNCTNAMEFLAAAGNEDCIFLIKTGEFHLLQSVQVVLSSMPARSPIHRQRRLNGRESNSSITSNTHKVVRLMAD